MAKSPSELAIDAGLDSLAQVSRISCVSTYTLMNWHKNKPHLFKVVLIGCKHLADKYEGLY